MKDLVLVAASGLGRETLAMVRDDPEFRVIGFLDDDRTLFGSEIDGVPVLGGLDDVAGFPSTDLVICAGSGAVRQAIERRLALLGVPLDRYATLVDRSARIPAGCAVGRGSILLAQVTLTAAVVLGRHVVAMPGVTITHDDVVGDFATLAAGVSLGGGVKVGRAAYIGMNASVRQGCVIGAGSMVGMGAAVIGDIPENEIWVGVPARRLRVVAARRIGSKGGLT